MPYSISAPTNLVVEALDAYNAPIQSGILQQQLQLDQQQVQSNAIALQNQMGLQQTMTQIWGPGGMGTASAAAQDPSDPSQSPKLMATAAALFKYGQPQAGGQFLSSMSLLNYRNVESQKTEQQTLWRQAEAVGSALGSVTNQQEEDTALAELRSQGIDPTRIGLTGDYTQDAPKLPVLARAGMSRAQQLQAQDRETSFAWRQQEDQFHNAVAQARLGQGAARIGQEAANLDLRAKEFADKQEREAKDDARHQEGLVKEKEKAIANAGKLQPADTQEAVGLLSQDERTSNLPDNVRKSMAVIAARQARQAVAEKMRAEGLTEEPAGEFDRQLQKALESTARAVGAAGFKFEPPPAPATAPVKPPLPKTPAGIPKGSKVIGKTPDGKDVWQDPHGNKWVE